MKVTISVSGVLGRKPKQKFPATTKSYLSKTVEEYKNTPVGKHDIGISKHVGNCMHVAEQFAKYCTDNKINAEVEQALFVLDHPSIQLSVPDSEEVKWMQREGIDTTDAAAVFKFMSKHYDMTTITHWIVVVDRKFIVDLSGMYQFVYSGAAKDLTVKHYRFDDFTKLAITDVLH